MKIIAVGVIHGRNTWKRVLEKEPGYDRFVFVGDYLDNFPPMTAEKILANFEEILELKRSNPGKVVLLIGNHDFHYMSQGEGEMYSGYNPKIKAKARKLFTDNADLFNVAYQCNDILFTHAGVTSTWAEDNKINHLKSVDVARQIDSLFEKNPDAFRFYPGDTSSSGDHIKQGPFWVRPRTLSGDMFPGLRQVVGHTGVAQIVTVEGGLTLIDTGRRGDYLKVVRGGKMIIGEPYLV